MMKYINSFNEKSSVFSFDNSDEESEIIKSGDLVSMPADGYRFSFEKVYKYKKGSKKYDYLLCKLKEYKGFNLYLLDKSEDQVSFLGYFDAAINKYHTSLLRSNNRVDAAYKYMSFKCSIFSFFDSLPDDDTIGDWFIYLTDHFEINSIDRGFVDYSSEGSFYNIVDSQLDTPTMAVSFNGLDTSGLNLDNSYRHDWKNDKSFLQKNEKFAEELKSCINRSSYYLENNYRYYKGYKILITSWGLVIVIIEFNELPIS